MQPDELRRILDTTLADGRLTRTERKALRAVLDEQRLSAEALARLRSDVFTAAREAVSAHGPDKVLDWLEDVLKVTLPVADEAPTEARAEAHFSPGYACRDRIVSLFEGARRTVEVCVFTVTDNHVAQAMRDAHRRGVEVRVVTDDLKAEDRGSDIDRLAQEGLPVRTDRTEAHMHHKFAIFDGGTLVTGSYNWTRSAFTENYEDPGPAGRRPEDAGPGAGGDSSRSDLSNAAARNIVVTGDPRLVAPFARTFEALWTGPDTGPHAPDR